MRLSTWNCWTRPFPAGVPLRPAITSGGTSSSSVSNPPVKAGAPAPLNLLLHSALTYAALPETHGYLPPAISPATCRFQYSQARLLAPAPAGVAAGGFAPGS